MGRPHWFTHPDANQSDIMTDVKDIPGLECHDISSLTDAQCPGDILCYFRGRWQPFEIKTSPSAKVSKEQAEAHEEGKVPIIYEVANILEFYGAIE